MGALARKIEKEGIQKGIQQGVQQVTLKLLQKGIDLAVIAESTGLTEEEIAKIEGRRYK